MKTCNETEIKNLGIYSDVYFGNPRKILILLDEIKRIENHDYFLDVYNNGEIMNFPVIIEENTEILSELLLNLDGYIERLRENFHFQEESGGKTCIDLVQLIDDFTKAHPFISIHYNAEDDYFFDPNSDENFDYYYKMETHWIDKPSAAAVNSNLPLFIDEAKHLDFDTTKKLATRNLLQ